MAGSGDEPAAQWGMQDVSPGDSIPTMKVSQITPLCFNVLSLFSIMFQNIFCLLFKLLANK
jgi:hypothetical protein